MRLGAPIILTPRHYVELEEEIAAYFRETIIRPLARVLKSKDLDRELSNAKDPLLDAVTNGYIYYDDGAFRGDFDSKTSRRLRELGAKWNGVTKSFFIDRSRVPMEVLTVQAQALDRFDKIKSSLIQTIDALDIDQQFERFGFTDKFDNALALMDDRFTETVSSIVIPPKLTPEMRRNIADTWAQNLKLDIKKWSAQSIFDLRQDVMQNAFAGFRSENMINMIQGTHDVSKRKAKFLARQETSLLMSKFREERYKDVGVSRYKWSTSHDGRVRGSPAARAENPSATGDHYHLDGKIFFFSSPPVVDPRTGRRANPGEDYNCRCIARPVFDGVDE